MNDKIKQTKNIANVVLTKPVMVVKDKVDAKMTKPTKDNKHKSVNTEDERMIKEMRGMRR